MSRRDKLSKNDSAIARALQIAGISSVLAIALVHCSYDWDVPSTSSAIDDDDAETTSSEAGTDANAARDAFASDVGSEAAVDASLPIVDVDASCSPSVRCASGSYCFYADQMCGTGDKSGVCTSNQGCAITSPGATSVCSCSGAVYPSACAARSDGQDVSATTTCSAPVNNFQCGYAFCPQTDFCIDYAGKDGGASSYACQTMGGCIGGCLCSQTKICGDAGTCSGAILDLSAIEVTCH